MATMVKEKRLEKKKSKKDKVDINQTAENERISIPTRSEHVHKNDTIQIETYEVTTEEQKQTNTNDFEKQSDTENFGENLTNSDNNISSDINVTYSNEQIEEQETQQLSQMISQDLVIEARPDLSQLLEKHKAELASESSHESESVVMNKDLCDENESVVPSAPTFLEDTVVPVSQCMQAVEDMIPVLKAVPLEEAIRLFGEREIAEVKAMSDREEAIVEGGSTSGPDHPLVDLLSTFKRSLTAMEQSRLQLACATKEEEKLRGQLWKVKKKSVSKSEKCSCGNTIHLMFTFETAELLKEKLPAAKMRLDALLRDTQECYCHHQHAALLAHCQIDELISDVCQGNKPEIRECLSLIFEALRLSDERQSKALTRWAQALSYALLKGRDLRQLVFLLHHLFRQSHSVLWAASVLSLSACDAVEAARVLAVLELMLHRSRLEAARECTEEETEEAWEEVDNLGHGSAVAEGVLRERDLLGLLDRFPLRALAMRLMMITNSNISTLSESDIGDPYYGRGVLRCCYGVRLLLSVLRRAVHAHAQYELLRERLCVYACRCMQGLALLHCKMVDSESYQPQFLYRVTSELEAIFVSGEQLLGHYRREMLPANLLRSSVACRYWTAHVDGLHATSPVPIPVLDISTNTSDCGMSVRVVAGVAVTRTHDHDLANMCAGFLLQTGLCKKPVPCKGICQEVARDCIPELLMAHPYLHSIVLRMVGDLAQSNPIEASHLDCLCIPQYRDTGSAVTAVLDKWRVRPPLLEKLLLGLDYTPHSGLSLETQLAISSWLSVWVTQAPPPAPDWPWEVLRKLRTHRTFWQLPVDAPPPDPRPEGLFQMANALLCSSWGHSIPLICTEGVSALLRLSSARPQDAVHCLSAVMLVLSHSPASVSLTPQFTEVFNTLLDSGPSLMQRALGRGGPTGALMLQELMMTQVLEESYLDRGAILSCWLHALFQTSNAVALAALDACVRASRLWTIVDAFLQEPIPLEAQTALIRTPTAPLLSECHLRHIYTQESTSGLSASLCVALCEQKRRGARIHVDNALQQLNSPARSEDLAIYKTATVALGAPFAHPAHLTIWRLFMHLYLQRPNNAPNSVPVGPLFFSGLIKSRTLAQLKKRLQDAILFHRNQSEAYKQMLKEIPAIRKKIEPKKDADHKVDNDILPSFSVSCLIGEPSETEPEEDRDGDMNEIAGSSESNGPTIDSNQMMFYHGAAEKLLSEYARWLDEGETTGAMPCHADIARFVTEQALSAAWLSSVKDCLPSRAPRVLTSPLPPQTSYVEKIRLILMEITDGGLRSNNIELKSPLESYKFTEGRLNVFESLLKNIENLASDWSTTVSRLSVLDAELLALVRSLRAPRPIPPISRSCPRNTCPPLTSYFSDQQWCISHQAERGIVENRARAATVLRKLARPRPEVAVTAAALISIARQVRSTETAKRVLDIVWKTASKDCDCAIADDALTRIVEYLTERWISHDGKLCAEILTRWSSSKRALQQTLRGCLVDPRRLRHNEWTNVYTAIVHSRLPSHVLFSHLSKFEMPRWAEHADDTQRQEIVDCIVNAMPRWGQNPDQEHHMFLELCGVHLQSIVGPSQLPSLVLNCTKFCVNCTLPAQCLSHVANVCANVGGWMSFDELGNLLRSLGMTWWEVRSSDKVHKHTYTLYAPPFASVLMALQRAFVKSGVALSYAPERVGVYAWSALQESWSPWISPHTSPPLVPLAEDTSTVMMKRFLDATCQAMLDCPGTEVYLLREVFLYAVHLHLMPAQSLDSKVQLSNLLNELSNLPWNEHQWIDERCIRAAGQACMTPDEAFLSWCTSTWHGATPASWAGDGAVPRLATLLTVFSTVNDPPLEAASQIPWYRLPELAVHEAFERWFALRHSVTTPYHTLPQFTVLLYASGLLCHPPLALNYPRCNRGSALSLWTRAACSPALSAHVSAMQTCLLRVVAALAPHIEGSAGELEELLSRAIVVMCIEPAATEALPVWKSWISSSNKRLVAASLRASSSLTALPYFAHVAEVAVTTWMQFKDSSWSDIQTMWACLPWDTSTLVDRSALHAAYAVAPRSSVDQIRAAVVSLANLDTDFVKHKTIISLWIVQSTRTAVRCGAASAQAECRAAVRGLLGAWAEERKRSLLRSMGLQADVDRPTDVHRLLSRFAQCVLEPNNAQLSRNFESSCLTVLGPNPGDVPTWSRSPSLNKLVRLAMRLHPTCDRYFKLELDASNDS